MNKPTNAEIKDLYAQETGFILDDSPAALLDFARAVLAKWGQLAQAAEADSVQEDAARVFTYKNQPCDNVTAWRFGEACRAAQPGGDPIDHGLSLLQKLQERGYGIVAIDAAMNKGGAA